MSEVAKSAIFEYQLEHQLHIDVRDGKIFFDESKQDIYITKMSIKPAIDIKRVEVLAHYPKGTEQTVAEAVGKILNVRAKATATKETTRLSKKTISDAKELLRNDTQEKVNESAIQDMSIQVITDMLNIPNQIKIDGDQFKIMTESSKMTQFITFRQSKKIKIFINAKEFAPMDEVEFVKRIFPQIEMTVYL